MSTKKEELVAIAREGGYEGDMPPTIAEAISAVGSVAGGGSGGGGEAGMVVTITESNGSFTADKTIDEVVDYLNAGNNDLIAIWDPSKMGYSKYLYFPFLSAPTGKDVTFARLVPIVHTQRGQSGAVQSIEVVSTGVDVFYYDNSGLKHGEYRVENQLVKVDVTMSADGTSATASKTNKQLYDLYNKGALIYFAIGGTTSTGGATTTNHSITFASDNYYVNFFVPHSDDGTSLKATKFTQTNTTASNKAYTVTQLS